MAQLPPKSPCTMFPSWQFTFGAAGPAAASFLPTPAPPAPGSQPPWVDEFLDFSSAKRSHHRRSVSDSMTAFQLDDEDDFDRLDDDQLLSMFSDSNVPAPSSSSSSAAEVVVPASSSSDQSSFSWDCQKPAADTQEKSEAEPPPEIIVDPKRVKRILANRQSAQRSRVRKLQYISELERSVTTLQSEVSALSPRVAFLDQQRSMLTLGNNQLKQRIAALAQDKIVKDAHQEELKNEVERLRQVYHHQQKLQTMASPTPTSQPTVITERELLC